MSSQSPTSSTSSVKRIPDPITNAPTAWIPLPSEDARAFPGGSTGTSVNAECNVLALVSLLASLIFPLALLAHAINILTPDAVTLFAASQLASVGIPAMLAAIIVGHIGLARARLYTPANAFRGIAIAGLAIGYLSMVMVIGVSGLFVADVIHGS